MSEEHASQSDLIKHLIDAAAMKADIDHIKSDQSDMMNRMLGALTEISSKLELMRESIANQPAKITECRTDMRHEIERDFPNRVDAVKMEQRIEDKIEGTDRKLSEQITSVQNGLNTRIDTVENKLDKQVIKITAAVSAVILSIGALAWIIDHLPIFVSMVAK